MSAATALALILLASLLLSIGSVFVVKRAEDRKTTSGGGTKDQRAAHTSKVERDQTASWEKAIAGQPTGAFKQFRISLVLNQGELIRHPKFGDGVVARVIDRGKVEILFKDGPRTMAHGQP